MRPQCPESSTTSAPVPIWPKFYKNRCPSPAERIFASATSTCEGATSPLNGDNWNPEDGLYRILIGMQHLLNEELREALAPRDGPPSIPHGASHRVY